MASMSAQRASSSSTPRWIYDVFLSFYGQDTRNSFTDHLYAALIQKDIIAFRDDEKLEPGKYVSEELLIAIEASICAVVIISENYASSKWCLNELAKIVERRRETGLEVFPVFYHVDPSDVREQKKSFAKAFARHREDPEVDEAKMMTWRDALRDVDNTVGWHAHDR
ncbi:toll/interleukin-1 receptor-like protein [Alnus glutinosa]|uniref:toll/interleukin-1 receptor-like protein n=1 Tax=Alnus glutinosa TaxID=3517 RepID=UPI002D76F836|nr:toll/interleukin-1 receptor-like protein [Alnus glutinosa]